MPSRPDLRELAANVKEAFAEMDRETLLDILTFVVKEYVVEGPPPMLVHQTETLADLQGLSFAQLVSALQTRLDHPELAMFAVDGDRVSVRVGGVMQPLTATRQPLTGAPAAAPAPAPAESPRPTAGVRVVETTLAQRPPQAQPAPRAQPAAPPPQPAPAAPPASAQATQPAPGGDAGDKPDASGDDASARFSLLELD